MSVKLKNDVLVVDIDDDIYDGYWFGVSYREIKNDLETYDGQFKSVKVLVNSNGGSVTEGMAIRKLFMDLAEQGFDVDIEIAGVAASIASVIALSGTTLKMRTGSYLMIHRPYTVTSGNHDDLRNVADSIESMYDDLIDIYGSKSVISVEEIKNMVDKETWITAKKAQEYGFAETIPLETNQVLNFAGTPQNGKSLMFNSFCNVPQNILNRDEVINTVPVEPTNKGDAMELQEFLAKNPEAKAEFDNKLGAAKATGADGANSAVAKVVESATKVLNSTVYPESIKAHALSAISGEGTVETMNAAVAAYDAVMEAQSSTVAQNGTHLDGETLVEGGESDTIVPENNGRIDSADALNSYLGNEVK